MANTLSEGQSRHEDAEHILRKGIEADPADARTFTLLAILLSDKLGRHEEAEAALAAATKLSPDDEWIWTAYGDLLYKKFNRFTEAEAAFHKAIDLNPDDPLPWSTLGHMLANQTERHGEAKAAYEKALALDPNDAIIWNSLGYLLADDPQRHDEAEMAYRKAIALDSNFAPPWKNLGILLEGSHLDQALAAYERGLELERRDDPYIRSRLRELKAQIAIADSQKAIDANDLQALRSSLATLLENPDDIATILVSERFVEGLLAQSLANHESAPTLLATMRALGYEKYARPLLLAFEAIIENRADMLSELEPEIQGAAKRMFKRLHAN